MQNPSDARTTDAALHRLADSIPQIVWLVDGEGRPEFFNRRWREYTGTSEARASVEEVAVGYLHPDDVGPTLDAWSTALREERAFEVEHRIRSAAGEYRWFLARAEPRRDPATGRISRWFGTSTDIHPQKEAERALRASETRYRALFDSIDEGFCVIQVIFRDGRAVDYRFLEGNPAWEKHTGLHGALGRTAREVLPELEEHWFRIYGEVARRREPVCFEEGSATMGRWFDVFAFPIDEPEECRVALLFTDTTEQRRAAQERERLLEAALRSEERYRLVNRATNDVIWDWDLATGELTWNAALETTFGHPVDAVPAGIHFWYEHLHPDDRERVVRGIHGAIGGGETYWQAEYRFRRADGTFASVLDRGVIARDGSGTPTRMIGSMLDISERQRLLAAEHAARAEAEAANRAKMDFLSAMSHELRTPLNAIGGYVDLLALGIHGPLAAPQQEALARVTANQRHLLTLINDVLAFARLEAGRMELEVRDLPACELLHSVEPLVAPLAQARGIALSVSECDRGVLLRGDEERVRQILLNLVTNAVKFTGEGGWVIRSCDADAEWVHLRVRDNGAGIAPEDRERIFDPFQQVGRRLNQPREGVGLGLAISRDLARAMGGELTVESEPGRGSTFTLRLPRAEG